MALSTEEKEKLGDFYRNKDLYDPAKDPEQEVSTFQPQPMNSGGEMGYAEGGDVGDDFSVSTGADTLNGLGAPAADPVLVDTGTTMADDVLSNPPAALDLKISPENFNPSVIPAGPPAAPRIAGATPKASPATLPIPGSTPPVAAPQASPAAPGKLGTDEYDQLIKYLQPSLGQRLGQGAMSGLGGLADAIETGVARGANPGFQKGIDERAQNQKQNLINALREKYETGFKGKELAQGQERIGQEGKHIAEEGRHNVAGEKIGSEEAAARLAEAKSGLQQNALEAAGRLSQNGGIFGYKNQPETVQAINELMTRAGMGAPGTTKVPTIVTKAQYDALPKGTHYQDAKGKPGVKQ